MSDSEVRRLEELWGGEFGDGYVDRNAAAANGRGDFWDEIHTEFPFKSVLEIGCNVGGNLQWLAGRIPPRHVYGVDVNEKAVHEVRRRIPGVGVLWSPARELPFRDRAFDMVFTTGVLIHQNPESLPIVMAEIVRCSRRWILCGEYYADEPTEIAYRGQTGALFKRDFGGFYQSLFPQLRLQKKGFLAKGVGSWDDVTYWVFEKEA